MELTEKTLNEEYIYKGRIIKVRRDEVELPNGHKSMREVVEHSGGVCVLPLTDRDEVIFVRQFRYPYKEVILEIPAGKRDHGEESPLECGKRELAEETGYTARELVDLGPFHPSPGATAETIHLFLARCDAHAGETHQDPSESIRGREATLAELATLIASGEFRHGAGLAAYARAVARGLIEPPLPEKGARR